jgi:uncharacterized repeat protein (TIGR03803 family)
MVETEAQMMNGFPPVLRRSVPLIARAHALLLASARAPAFGKRPSKPDSFALAVTFLLLSSAVATPAAAQYTVLCNFDGVHGATPRGPVVVFGNPGDQVSGTTVTGGTSGDGTFFDCFPGGGMLGARSFNGLLGNAPWGGDAFIADGIIGSTVFGGANGLGNVWFFEGTAQILFSEHDFDGTDGANPSSPLLTPDGVNSAMAYGTTSEAGPGGGGTVFAIPTNTGTSPVTTLHSFTGPDGSQPYGGLVRASDGLLYGTTSTGGANGKGTIYKLDTSGNNFMVIHDFAISDGSFSNASLIQGTDGFLYGTAAYDGPDGSGTIFKTDASGNNFTVLHAFNGSDGAYPFAPVVEGADGLLYGTTNSGGAHSFGNIYRLDTSGGHFVVLHDFAGADGATPYAGLTPDPDGNLFGTASAGGTNAAGGPSDLGVVFEFIPGAWPHILRLAPTSGPVLVQPGDPVQLTGTNFPPSAQLSIGGSEANGVTVVNDRQIDANTPPSLAPGSLNDVVVTDPATGAAGTLPRGWFADFLDVDQSNTFHPYVETIVRHSITVGCGAGDYCPGNAVTRAQMAVFLLKAEHGSGYFPPACAGIFGDVPCPSPYANWIEELSAEGITAGCGGGNYCPAFSVTRAQMAVFLLKTEHGSSYTPPACTGVFTDVPCPSPFAGWIEQLHAEGITGGCGNGNYCPANAVTRGQMAVFLVKTFNLQ